MDHEVSSTFNDLERKLKALEDELAQVDLDVEQPATPDPAGIGPSPEVVTASPPSGDGITWETPQPPSREMPNLPVPGHVDEPRSSEDRADRRPDGEPWDDRQWEPAQGDDKQWEPAQGDDKQGESVDDKQGEPVIRWEDEEGTSGIIDSNAGGVTDSTDALGEASVVWDEQLREREVESIDIDQRTDEAMIDWGEQRAVPDQPIAPLDVGESVSPSEPISPPATPIEVARGSKLASYRSQLDRIARELGDITGGLSEEQNELLRFRQQLEQTTKGLIGDYERLLTSLRDDGDPPASS